MMLHTCLKFTISIIISTIIISSCGYPANITPMTFSQVFGRQWGNVSVSDNGTAVTASLLRNLGSSGFASQVNYTSGLFSAYIKLPWQNYTAGVAVTFYLKNDLVEHDEIDFEILGHTDDEEWTLQTNFYAYGRRPGSEERYKLWFDPSKETHKYSIFWSENRVLYYIDDLPIREIPKLDVKDAVFPSRPMQLYGSIWNSSWVTNQAEANFTFEPFVAEYSGFGLNGCWFDDPRRNVSVCEGSELATGCEKMTSEQLKEYQGFRRKYLTYSYCDKNWYLPECLVRPGNRSA